jgi:hypothetical protein
MTDDAGREKQPTQETCPKANGERMIEDEDSRGSGFNNRIGGLWLPQSAPTI